MSILTAGASNDRAGEAPKQLQTTDLSSRQRGCPTSTNPQLSDSNKILVMGPRWVPDVCVGKKYVEDYFNSKSQHFRHLGLKAEDKNGHNNEYTG
jgi:hypothetical protein